MQAAFKGAEQIGFTIMSLTISLIAVLIPLLFMGDIVGPAVPGIRHHAERDDSGFRLRLADADADDVLAAAAPHAANPSKGGSTGIRARVEQIIEFYGRTLQWVLKHQTATLLVAAGTLVLTVLLYIIVPKGFFPVQDTGIIQGISEAPQAISFRRHGGKAAGACAGDSAGSRRGQSFVVHRRGRHEYDAEQRADPDQSQTARSSATSTPSDVIRRLQPELAKVDGITLYMQPVQDLTVEDRVSRTQYQYTLEDPDQNELNTWTAQFVDKLKAVAGASRRGHGSADRRGWRRGL